MMFEHSSKNKKILFVIFALLLLGGIFYLSWSKFFGEANEHREVQNLVEIFGKRLQNVSLLAPRDVLTKSMEENYGDLVSSPLLIAEWVADAIEDPTSAPGRLTSSPWPDLIKISNIEKLSSYTYEANGKVIETAVDAIAVSRPIAILIEKRLDLGNRWLIASVTIGPYDDNQTNNLAWETIKRAVSDCEAEKAFQTHSQLVTLELKNGRELTAIEPNIDDIMKIVSAAEAKCGRIIMATE